MNAGVTIIIHQHFPHIHKKMVLTLNFFSFLILLISIFEITLMLEDKQQISARKAMTLYRLNLKLSQGFFTVVGCLEIALRNAINKHYLPIHGVNWLQDSTHQGGIFDRPTCVATARIIEVAVTRLGNRYTHDKLIAELDFGFWRYLFARHQFHAGGQSLLTIFPNLPPSNVNVQYNHNFIFSELEKVNMWRNRLAHHEPICFVNGLNIKSTAFARDRYALILIFFNWMDIDYEGLLYGLDNIESICDKIDQP